MRKMLWLVVLAGLAAVVVCGLAVLQDWRLLRVSWAAVGRAMASGDPFALNVAATAHNAYRLNCFAEGVGVMLGAILAAIGLHGLALTEGRPNAAGKDALRR